MITVYAIVDNKGFYMCEGEEGFGPDFEPEITEDTLLFRDLELAKHNCHSDNVVAIQVDENLDFYII